MKNQLDTELLSSASKILGNLSWLIIERLFALPMVLIVNIAIARDLGASLFGTLNYLLAITSIIPPLAALGLNSIIIRELSGAGSAKDEARILASTLVFRLGGAAVGCLLSFLLLPYLRIPGDQVYLYVLLVLSNSFYFLQLFDFWFQYKVKSAPVSRCKIYIVIAFSILKLAALWLGHGLEAIVVLQSVELVAVNLSYAILYRLYSGALDLRLANTSYGVSLLKQSYWLILSGVAAVVYLKVDQFMLGQMLGSVEVGVYSAAARLSEVWYFLPVAIVQSFFPRLLEIERIDGNAYRHSLQKICDLLLVIAFVLAVLASFYSELIIGIVYGEQYSGSAMVLAVHIWAGVFVFMRALLSKWLIAEKLLFYSFVTQGVGALANVLLNLVLIPDYGVVGSAFATLLSYAGASYFSLFLSRKTMPMARIMTCSLMLIPTLGRRYWVR
ncbi:flippase [Pseudomaricurvus alcaniphilus]|uniref:oligosaccharide flippase family protein n=1 Tax=Pseudomaricurvus alcaniphilus TaxID=1166482 RepID=UPI00140CC9C2|nr:flippase [Pseudomaricurvus alcaniphilus]